MNQAVEGFSSQVPAPSAGNLNEISSEIERDMRLRLQAIDDIGFNIGSMIEMLVVSPEVNLPFCGVLRILAAAVSDIREQAYLGDAVVRI